jgi:hypothetical protein
MILAAPFKETHMIVAAESMEDTITGTFFETAAPCATPAMAWPESA